MTNKNMDIKAKKRGVQNEGSSAPPPTILQPLQSVDAPNEIAHHFQ